MRVHRFDIDGILLIEPKRFRDRRGFFAETYNAAELADQGVDVRFVQDAQLLSTAAGTVRGLHFQSPPFAQGQAGPRRARGDPASGGGYAPRLADFRQACQRRTQRRKRAAIVHS